MTRLSFLFISLLLACPPSHAADPVKLIFDTDMASDCDDVGALAVLNALSDLGEVKILAIVTNRKCPGNASARACDAPVESLSFYPLVCDFAGSAPPAHLEGLSLKPFLHDAEAE